MCVYVCVFVCVRARASLVTSLIKGMSVWVYLHTLCVCVCVCYMCVCVLCVCVCVCARVCDTRELAKRRAALLARKNLDVLIIYWPKQSVFSLPCRQLIELYSKFPRRPLCVLMCVCVCVCVCV